MKFAHRLPFGAEVEADGRVRFRLWAPRQPAVSVALEDSGEVLPMEPEGEGWFSLVTDRTGADRPYRYQLADGFRVPDPAARAQAEDAHGPSLVIDPRAFAWRHTEWRGRPWHETVLYELHLGSFTDQGGFDGLRGKLDHFERLGVTAIELMPVADFPGRRNWGYDGVLMYAPDRAYGTVEQLKTLVDEAHGRGLMVFLDVVYNHFGPDGNYLHLYAPSFFTERFHTPWGAAIDFARRPVRDFYINNALYWLNEFRFDGLRFDAVHAIEDDSDPDILVELAETVRRHTAEGRHVHLVLENDSNVAGYLGRDGDGRPTHYVAQWNDDMHHVGHVLLTGESGGYYGDYVERPHGLLARGLAQGFVYQGAPSAFRDGALRGEPSAHLPPTAFVDFLQNHDQVGNRAYGERLTRLTDDAALRALTAVFLLSPSIPLLFMGEEWAAEEPFLFFCDFHDQLADAVREGRRREFARFPQFADPAARQAIPDPNADSTFDVVRLSWPTIATPQRLRHIDFTTELLRLRREQLWPRLPGAPGGRADGGAWGERGVRVEWALGDGSRLGLLANLGDRPGAGCPPPPAGDTLYQLSPDVGAAPDLVQRARDGGLPPWSVLWRLDARAG